MASKHSMHEPAEEQVLIGRMVLFGATGDLAGRYLLPALAALQHAQRLPDDLRVVGAAVEDWDDERFRAHAAERLDNQADGVPAEARDALLRALCYRRVDFADTSSVAAAVAALDAPGDPVAAYLALPTGPMPAAIRALSEIGLPPGSRIAVEKPFGEDLESARSLNGLLAEAVGSDGEQAVFRVDHFLGLAPVQNLLGLRLANPIIDVLWNSRHVERIEIVWEETLALEGRASFYDHAGALRDVVQNHLMQVLCLVAMEPPADVRMDLRDRKLDVLRAVRPLEPEAIASRTRRARYTAGRIGGLAVPDYVAEEGVEPERCTETFAEVTLELDSERWTGTPFVLRAAKAMGRDRMEVVVRFRAADRLPFPDGAGKATPDELRIGLDEPGYLRLCLTGTTPGPPLHLTPMTLAAHLRAWDLPEYGRVLHNLLSGDSTLSVRGDEAEEAWRILDPVLTAWEEGRVPLEVYPAGSEGPVR